MDFIISAMNDFYECCDIPVKAISYELTDIYIVGYCKYFEDIFPVDQIKHLIHNSDDLSSFHLEIDNNIYYKIVSISNLNKYKGFFVLGPMVSKQLNNNEYNIPYRSIECSNYMSKLILNITEDKFSRNISNNAFNPYIRKAIEYVHEHYDKDITIPVLCEYLDINKSYFCSLFKKYTGNTFSYFLNYFRVEKSKKLLTSTDLNLLEIAMAVGFNNQNYYSIVFKKYTNKTPSEYRICNSLKYSS